MQIVLEGSDKSVKALKKYMRTWFKINGIKEVEAQSGSNEEIKEELRKVENNLNNYKSKLKKANAEIAELKKDLNKG